MAGSVVRISARAHSMLRRIARQSGESMQATITKAIELYRRQLFLEKANIAFTALRRDSRAWQDEVKEREAWDSTLLDETRGS